MNDSVTQFSIIYRPRTLDDVYGQDSVIKDLKKRASKDNWPKAMLFQGPFGTGKTTIAQIVAAMMEAPDKEGNPDWEHPSNKAIISESFNRDVERLDGSQLAKSDMVEFTSHLRVKPLYDKKRILIIEEADQLSTAAINALLKVLESPQPNTHFILLSMEEKGIPNAIKSRCQVYKIKSLGIQDTMMALHDVMIKSGCQDNKDIPDNFKTYGLSEIAKAAKGSMRSALQILEKCLVGEIFNPEDIKKEFFVIDENSAITTLKAILNLSKDEAVWWSIAKANPTDFYFYLTSILANVLAYNVSGFMENDYFENSYKELSLNISRVDYLYNLLVNSPCMNKQFLRKADIIGIISQYYRHFMEASEISKPARVRVPASR